MSTPINDAHDAPRGRDEAVHTGRDGADEVTTTKAGNSARHGAGLFDIRNIIGLLMALYGLILLVVIDCFILNYVMKGRMAQKFGGKENLEAKLLKEEILADARIAYEKREEELGEEGLHQLQQVQFQLVIASAIQLADGVGTHLKMLK